MWRDVQRSRLRDEITCVVGLVGTDSDALVASDLSQHFECGFALGRSRRFRDLPIHRQPVPILHYEYSAYLFTIEMHENLGTANS